MIGTRIKSLLAYFVAETADGWLHDDRRRTVSDGSVVFLKWRCFEAKR